MARSVLLTLLGSESSAVRALRNVGQEADRTADHVDRLDDSNRRSADGAGRSEESHGRLSSVLSKLAPAAGQAAASIGMVAAGIGTVVPAVAGLSAALVAIAPAAAVAATGVAAVGLAGAALKIGMIGVGEAIKQGFSAKGDPEKLAAAMKNLSPNARAFVGELLKLKPAFGEIKTAVQDSLFQGLDRSFATAAKTTLPIFRQGLVGAATALNGMGKGLLSTVTELGKSGTLKTLFSGATQGLGNLTKIPGQLVKGLVQVGAAAAPTFAKMTAGIGGFATKASNALSGAFKSGAMSQAISVAVGLLKELAGVAKNVFTIVGNIFGAAQASGGGFVGTLRTITGALAQISGNGQFQAGLQAIFGVMSNLAQTAAPLLAQALLQIAPVFTALAPAANALVAALGQALQPVIAALGPVLVAAAQAVGQLVIAFAPLLPVVGQLIAALLPVLVPVLQLVTTVLTALTPVIAVVAQAMTTYLVPVITTVVGWVTQAIQWFTNLASQVFPALVGAVTSASGPFATLGTALVNLWTNGIQPLAVAVWDLVQRVFTAVAPALVPIGAALSTLARVLVDGLAFAINFAVIPAVNLMTDLLSGRASEAVKGWADTVAQGVTTVGDAIGGLADKSEPGLIDWISSVTLAEGRVSKALLDGIDKTTLEVVKYFKALPGQVVDALSSGVPTMRSVGKALGHAFVVGLHSTMPEVELVFDQMKKLGPSIMRGARSLLVAAGKAIISGFIEGIRSQIGAIAGVLKSITSMIPSWKGPPDKDAVLLRPAGISIMGGLIDGIDSQIPKLGAKLKAVTELISKAGKAAWSDVAATTQGIDIGDKLIKALHGTAAQVGDAVKAIAAKIKDAFKNHDITAGQRDSLLDWLAGSNKQLQKLAEERQKIIDKIKEARDYAKKITQEALSFASITSIKTEGGGTPTGQQLVAGLQAKLAQIRGFAGNIKKLAQAGLSKSLLRQILDAGIDGGSAIAAELANGPNSIIAALNAAQTTIDKVAKGLGLNAADLLYDSGKNAGTGFLKGLQSMEQAMTDAMNQIILALLEALGIGVDKYKKKMDELAHLMQQTALMQPPTIPAPGNATPNPLRVPTVPRPQLVTAPTVRSFTPVTATMTPAKTVNITQHVTVKDRTDADMLLNQAAFRSRSLTF